MEQVENAKQLPVLQPQQAVASSASYGKFKNADELLRAYLNLEAEFTRKSQKLKSLIKDKNDNLENLTNEVINFNANEKLSATDCEKTQENLQSDCALVGLGSYLNERLPCENFSQEKSCESELILKKVDNAKISEEICEEENAKSVVVCEKNVAKSNVESCNDCLDGKEDDVFTRCKENDVAEENNNNDASNDNDEISILIESDITPLKSCDNDTISNQKNKTENFVQKMCPNDSSKGKDMENSSYILGLLDGAEIDGELKDELKGIAKNSGEGSVVLALAYKIAAMKNKLSDNDLLKEVVNSNSIVKQHVIKNYIEEINSLNLPNLSVGKYPSFTAQKAYKPKSIFEAGNIAKGLF